MAEKKSESFEQVSYKEYPTHGIIGSSPPGWCDLGSLHRRPTTTPPNRNARRRKLDLEDALGTCNSSLCRCPKKEDQQLPETSLPDWNEGKRTSDVYPVESNPNSKILDRFDNPSWFKGYGAEKKQHPFYTTTSSQYGKFPPNVHTMPVKYCPVKNVFSEHLSTTGMGRNRSLNIK